MVTKTQNELLKELEKDMYDKFRVVGAALKGIEEELTKVSNDVEKFKSVFRLLNDVEQVVEVEVPVDIKMTYSITSARKHLQGIFGKRLFTEDFMNTLIDMGFIRKYNYENTAGYKTTKCGRDSGWFEFHPYYTPVFNEIGMEHIITSLEQNGWKKL